MRLSRSVSLKKGFHQQISVDRAVLGFKHDPDVFGRLVTHIDQQRAGLRFWIRSAMRSMRRDFLDLIGEFRSTTI